MFPVDGNQNIAFSKGSVVRRAGHDQLTTHIGNRNGKIVAAGVRAVRKLCALHRTAPPDMCILKFSRDGRKGSFVAFPVGAIQHRWNGFQKDGIPIAVEQMQVRGIVVQRIPKPEQPQQPEVRVGVVRPVFRFVGKIRNPSESKKTGAWVRSRFVGSIVGSLAKSPTSASPR